MLLKGVFDRWKIRKRKKARRKNEKIRRSGLVFWARIVERRIFVRRRTSVSPLGVQIAQVRIEYKNNS